MNSENSIFKALRILALLLITSSITSLRVNSQLIGSYTIDPMGTGDYYTLCDAVSALISQGVDGPVTFNIASGTYDEQVEITAITGAGPVNTVTFQSNTGNAENVEITFKATSGKPYTVLLEGADYVNFENLTITATDSTYSTALEMAGSCSNISVGNCIINSISNASNTAAIYSTDNFHENIDIYGNTINDGLYGIFLDGENSGLSNNLTITGNTIQGQYAGGIYIMDYIAPSVNANTIISDSTTYNYYAIYLKNCNNAYTITKNQITVFDEYGGIIVENSDGLNVNFGMITNNMINLKGEGMITMNGISTRNSDYVNVYFNTVRIIGSNTSPNSNAYYNYGGSYLKVLNNIFCNFGSGRAYFTTNLASIFSSDYNCLFTGGDLIAATGNSYYPTLTLFSQATSKDTNSIFVNPAFLADSDLHATSWFLDGAGVLITGQDEDFDGDIRSNPPDIGADEFTSALYPLDEGTYTIGGISPHYNTIKEAMDDVQQRGVLAPTTFKIRTGEYNEYVGNIYKIPGSNAENPVVLISETGNHENVTIFYSTTNEEGNIFNLKNVDYFTIRDLTISAVGDTDGRPIRISGSIKDLRILNNHLSSTITDWTPIYIRAYTDSLLIAENSITQGEYGIFLQDNSPSGINSTNTRIIRNSIEGTSTAGIWVQGQDSPKIIGNNIINQTYTSFEGINIQSCHYDFEITGNSIYCDVSSTGIEMQGCDSYPSFGLISNNMISIGGNYIAYGIYLSETERINIYHNSVNITSSHQDYGIGFYIGFENNEIELINNIIANTGLGYALVADDPGGIIASDFNNIFASGIGRFAKWGTDVADLSALQTASGRDVNSISLDPLFYSETDLHSKQGGLIEKATPLAMVPYDIDSVLRDPEHPDIGAAEILCLLDMTVDSVTNISCNGRNDGMIYITVTGNAPPFSFAWTNGDTTEDVSGLAPGKYFVTVTDTNLCYVSDSATITDPAILTSNITDSTNVTLPGGSDGQATVTPAGGTPAYSFLWDDESNTSNSTVTGLLANKYYHVTVTDFNGCLTLDSVILSEPGVLRVEITDSTMISCNSLSDGTATATVWGGDPPYSLQWNDEDNAKTNLVTGLGSGKWYRVVVTDIKMQIARDSIMLPEPETFIITKDYSDRICSGENNGFINIDVDGGTAPYTFLWNTGEDTSDLEGLDIGEYVLNITDANGCTLNDTTHIDIFTVYEGEEICMVTVSSSNRLLIVWEKTEGKGTAFYKIYRRGIMGGFDNIGTQPFGALSVYQDEASVPDEMSYEYKISAVDSCGNESELSSLHKSIHLNASRGDKVMNLVWNEYTGYEYFNYQIYRGSSFMDLHKYRLVPYTNLTYTDTDPPSGVLYYRIGASKLEPCFPSGAGKKSMNEEYELAMSNIDDNGMVDVQDQVDSRDLLIYPNPITKSATLCFNNSGGKSYTLYLLDLSGKVCRIVNDINTSEYVLERKDLNAGLYFIELRGEKVFRGKFMVE